MQGSSGTVAHTAELGERRGRRWRVFWGGGGDHRQAATIGTVVAEMSGGVEAVHRATAHVAAVATQTTEATLAMRTSAQQVASAIESIAAVSEESAAGAEEVSASTQEQTAGVEEMASGAQELAALANELQGVVGQFTLEDPRPGGARTERRSADSPMRVLAPAAGTQMGPVTWRHSERPYSGIGVRTDGQ